MALKISEKFFNILKKETLMERFARPAVGVEILFSSECDIVFLIFTKGY